MKEFVFITDTHFMTQCRVRTGDVVEDLLKKFKWVIDYCNSHNCDLLLGGDIFDRPSVPDFLKSRVAALLASLKGTCYGIPGNHDRLYANPDFDYKTSYNVLVSSGLIVDVKEDIEFDEVVLSSTLPILTKSKPQIVLFHGFLNKDDGMCTVRYSDLQTTSQAYLLLGHDHSVYEPLEYGAVKIFRPGSLLRGIRLDEQCRVPQLMHIRASGEKLQYKMVDIPCRSDSEIFKTKSVSVDKVSVEQTYSEIIAQIRNASQSEVTLEQALSTVAEPDVVAFGIGLLNQVKQENANKRQSL